MSERLDTEVLVVGAGPVGLTLAIDLARRGVGVATCWRCAIAASRRASSATTSRRARWRSSAGSASSGGPRRRAAGGLSRTTSPTARRMTGARAGAHPDPVPARPLHRDRGPDTWWPTPEPPHRINQIFLEPILFEHAAATPALTHPQPDRVRGLRAGRDGVARRARDLDNGERLPIARALSGRLRRRPLAGAPRHRRQLSGDAVVQRVQSTYIRAPELLAVLKRPAGLGDVLAQPAPQRQRLRDRRPRDLAECTTTCATTRRISTRSTATGRSARSSASAPDFDYEVISQGGLVRPAAGRRPLPRPARVHLRRRRAPLGARTPATA